ncbi:UDP-N-acetylmuramoyl-tripeptide--D-alanyl-D-alanine ligase [Oceaniovalibus sp. ACAM 378]|uniref:UDP-N-acetylmuramoyl-tripeptide--D-alanyl-D- alanine ligase n=1 Tax=Oceaniovalibus sp. ACAM 378 TaxID=2599923 RepID=UPI0011DA08B2|nr:UDP-N-acetylmuramoyl-tripeptide--D-alanyl-D-alanine ligase [Oceaniovalibus sp. ACAM 378]TYB87984.1 UDP-N-acetylmuramoyl-tripeptide--D-alanyl-D-alanine ligase [Oceaniovalibus sp. ACAM 378]
MNPLWTRDTAVQATGGTCATDWQATGVSIDTRTLAPGDLFVALSDQRDGHEFVARALAAGAVAAMVSRIPDGVAPDAPLLLVPDVLAALGDMARVARARTDARVIGITGSVGKTSAKEMLRCVLAGQGRTHAAEASYNNHWGVPLTLARMPADTEFAVIEMGMNHPGEIAPLTAMTRPHVALITTVAAAHLEAFDDIDGIAREKAAIFAGLEPGGIAIVNLDLPTTPILLAEARAQGATILGYGRAESADYRLTDITLTADSTVVQALHGEERMLFKVMSPGSHFAMNALGVLATAGALDTDPALAACDIAKWAPPPGRGTRETVPLDAGEPSLTIELIDDAFNANPTSMVAALEVLAASQPVQGIGRIAQGRRIAILGDMLELGPDEVAMHRAIGDLPTIGAADLVHCVGPLMKHLWDTLPGDQRGVWVAAAPELAAQAHRLVDAGDIVLVKGSKGSKVSLVVDAIRKLGHRGARNAHPAGQKGID